MNSGCPLSFPTPVPCDIVLPVPEVSQLGALYVSGANRRLSRLERQDLVLNRKFTQKKYQMRSVFRSQHPAAIYTNPATRMTAPQERITPKEGAGGYSPHAASPSGGERGSPSRLPQKISELQEKEDFNKAGKTKKNPVDHGEVSQQRSTGNTTRYSHVTTAFLKRHHASTNMSEVNTTRPRYDMRMSAGVYW